MVLLWRYSLLCCHKVVPLTETNLKDVLAELDEAVEYSSDEDDDDKGKGKGKGKADSTDDSDDSDDSDAEGETVDD